MQEMQGKEDSDITNDSLLALLHFKPEENTLIRVLQTEKPILNLKKTYWNKDGHEITSLTDSYPLYNEGKLIGAIEIAKDITSLEKLIYQPLRRYGEPLTFDIITAVSEEMKMVIQAAKKAAYAETPVLLIGESGTGKDMIAEGIHHYLTPKKEKFSTIFCRQEDALLMQKITSALESELPRTLFFERIEFLQLETQDELLHLLKRSTNNQHMLIASTGSDPIELVSNGNLLKELYYFFSAFSIIVPPLKCRKIDIKPFVDDYFKRHRSRFQSSIQYLNEDVLTLFLAYDWPGNLKELELLLDEVTATITNERALTLPMLPAHFLFKVQANTKDSTNLLVPQTKQTLLPFDEFIKQAEILYLKNALNMFNGNVTKAAEAIQMSRQNLQYRLRKMKNN
jgi:arginine utilization regulatory protein